MRTPVAGDNRRLPAKHHFANGANAEGRAPCALHVCFREAALSVEDEVFAGFVKQAHIASFKLEQAEDDIERPDERFLKRAALDQACGDGA